MPNQAIACYERAFSRVATTYLARDLLVSVRLGSGRTLCLLRDNWVRPPRLPSRIA